MSKAIRMKFEPLRMLSPILMGPAYTGIGTKIANPARQILVQNLTDVRLVFSLDGVNDHFPLPAGGFFLSDITSNKTESTGFFLSKGERLYVRTDGAAGTTGAAFFSVIYGDEE